MSLFDFLECSDATSISSSYAYQVIVGDIKIKPCTQNRKLVNGQGEIKSIVYPQEDWVEPTWPFETKKATFTAIFGLLVVLFCFLKIILLFMNIKTKKNWKTRKFTHRFQILKM